MPSTAKVQATRPSATRTSPLQWLSGPEVLSWRLRLSTWSELPQPSGRSEKCRRRSRAPIGPRETPPIPGPRRLSRHQMNARTERPRQRSHPFAWPKSVAGEPPGARDQEPICDQSETGGHARLQSPQTRAVGRQIRFRAFWHAVEAADALACHDTRLIIGFRRRAMALLPATIGILTGPIDHDGTPGNREIPIRCSTSPRPLAAVPGITDTCTRSCRGVAEGSPSAST